MSDMVITIQYTHFDQLNQNVLRLGNEVREAKNELKKCKDEIEYLRHRALALREAGDEIWYCYRHKQPLNEAIEEWVEVRDGQITPEGGQP